MANHESACTSRVVAMLTYRLQWRNEMGELLVAIQEELDTSQTWLFRLVLEAPFDVRFRP